MCELLHMYVRYMCMYMWCIRCTCVIYFCGAYVYVHVWFACVSLCACGAHEHVCGMCVYVISVYVLYVCETCAHTFAV